jgi:hypothetical protein
MVERKPPNQWVVKKYADVGTSEPFLGQFLELFDILGGTLMREAEKDTARNAMAMVLNDGLLPAFLELRSIHSSKDKDLPLVDELQLYEDFSRKLWKAYKDLLQRAATAIGFDIGFLFQKDEKFEEGLTKFRVEHSSAPESLEPYLRETRKLWQNDLKRFRNEFLEHQQGDRSEYLKFYEAEFASSLFNAVWRTIIEILVMLMGLRLPPGIFIVEPDPDGPGPRWPKRFQFQIERKSTTT